MIRLKEMRKISNMTQQDVANYLHISRTAYCLIENEKRSISINDLEMLAKLFNVTIDYLDGTDPHKSESFTELTSYDEHTLILKYRTLNNIGKRVVLTTVNIVAGNHDYSADQ